MHSGVSRSGVPEAFREAVASANSGVAVYVLDGRAISDLRGFITELRRVVPLDPDLTDDGRSFDAIEDALFGGLTNDASSAGLIVWLNPEVMAAASDSDFRRLDRVLQDLCELLSGPRPAGSDYKLRVVLASDA